MKNVKVRGLPVFGIQKCIGLYFRKQTISAKYCQLYSTIFYQIILSPLPSLYSLVNLIEYYFGVNQRVITSSLFFPCLDLINQSFLNTRMAWHEILDVLPFPGVTCSVLPFNYLYNDLI